MNYFGIGEAAFRLPLPCQGSADVHAVHALLSRRGPGSAWCGLLASHRTQWCPMMGKRGHHACGRGCPDPGWPTLSPPPRRSSAMLHHCHFLTGSRPPRRSPGDTSASPASLHFHTLHPLFAFFLHLCHRLSSLSGLVFIWHCRKPLGISLPACPGS